MLTFVSIACGLFWSAFLAATILPFSSEAALSAALLGELPPLWCLAAATLGNSLGSMTTYSLGRLGKLEWLKKYCRISETELEAAKKRIAPFQAAAAFLCFLPLFGDLFAIALGFLRYPAGRFILLMTAGKFLRYLLWLILHLYVTKIIA